MFIHEPVMKKEVVNAFLDADNKNLYVDGTGGGGGHANAVMVGTSVRKSLLIDRDIDAVAHLKSRFETYSDVLVAHGNMSDIDKFLFQSGEAEIDMLLADLGVSSYQLDTEGRGFSWKFEDKLDLRMDASQGETALDMIRRLTVSELQQIFSTHAQERESKKVAIALKKAVDDGVVLTREIKECMVNAKRYHRKKRDDAAPLFMALRIALNKEIEEMETLLKHGFMRLAVGGVMAIITFHSGEERVVRSVFRDLKAGLPLLDPRLGHAVIPGKVELKKKMKPSEAEIERNVRSRSAALFILKKHSN
ncbi:16S rRNA (cytosine(1402)-N(4))-methyltransferase RsmH [bacterium]|nr:16S rRNA (cytosine(1402)-N(4))-methyltransferase RsmH [bacterium]